MSIVDDYSRNYGSIFRSLRMNHLRISEVRKLSLKIRLEGK